MNYMEKRKERVGETVQAISRGINIMDNDQISDIGIELTTMHRTLQQNFMRVVIAFIKEQAKNDKLGYYDLRNEETVKLCSKLWETLEETENYNPSDEDVYLPTV